MKGKDPKKVTVLEDDGARYNDSKSITNKIGDTLAELSSPRNNDNTFLEM